MKNNKVVIIGVGETAQIAYEYFTYDSDYEVSAFCVEKEIINNKTMFDLPVVPLESIEELYPNNEYQTFVALSFGGLNRNRARLYNIVKEKGYKCAKYISSKAFVWNNVKIGENCFIFENNVIQFGVTIGNNVIIWSGNHIGHQTKIGDNVFISSHVVISGYCDIGDNCFLGVNSSFNDGIVVQQDVVTGNGTIVTKNLEKGKVYVGNPAKPIIKSSYRIFKIEE